MAKGYLYDNGDELITREDVNELPDSSSAYEGYILSLDEDKEPVWSPPSGGGGGSDVYYIYKTGEPTQVTIDGENLDKYECRIVKAINPDGEANVIFNQVKNLFEQGNPIYFKDSDSYSTIITFITDSGITGYPAEIQFGGPGSDYMLLGAHISSNIMYLYKYSEV